MNQPGRKSRNHLTSETRRLMDEAGLAGAQYIKSVTEGKQKGKVSGHRVAASLESIAHSIGKAKTTLTISDGKVRSMADVAALAATGRLADGTVPTSDDELSYLPEAQDGAAPV